MKTRIAAFVSFKNDAPVLAQCLTRLSEFADVIFCLDDGSTDGSHDIARSFKKVEHFVSHPPGGVWNGRRNLRTKYEAMMSIRPEWIMNLDPDDIVDARFAALADDLLSRQDVGRYTFQEITLWDGNTHYRTDKPDWYSRAICYTPMLIRWTPELKWSVGSTNRRKDFLNRCSHSTTLAWFKHLFKPHFLKNRKSKYGKLINECFFPSDYMNYTNGRLTGFSGEVVNLELKKIHYHYFDLHYAFRKQMTYALMTAVKQHRLESEIPDLIDWAMKRLDLDGLETSPVLPEWGVI